MAFTKGLKKIDMNAIRAHRAFAPIVTVWVAVMLGLAAWIVQGNPLYGLLGAIAGALVGRYIAARLMVPAVEDDVSDVPETERDKRLRRVLGPDAEEEPEEPADFDDDLSRILASREPRQGNMGGGFTSESEYPVEETFGEPVEETFSDYEPADYEPEAELFNDDQEERPAYLSIEELQFDAAEEGFGDEVDLAEEDGSDEDGSDEDWPRGGPEWSNPGAALAEAMGAPPQPGNRHQPAWEEYAREQTMSHDAEEDIQTAQEFEAEPLPMTLAEDAEAQSAESLAMDVETVPASPTPEIVAEPGEHAAAKLRAQDLSQMSLVQMIERLAFAMDDYRERRDQSVQQLSAYAPDRTPNAEVAETLRALPALKRAAQVYATDGNAALDLSTREEAEATEEALREALQKLQRLSGG